MNRQEMDIVNSLVYKPFVNQRILSEVSGHSLGVVNRSLKHLVANGYLDDCIRLTEKAQKMLGNSSPRNAVILAAGFGMRMVPINTQTPKALMKVKGETLVERIIDQLHEVGIEDIYVVVGYMKEQFEFLMDREGVELIVNEKYGEKNNLHSLRLAANHLSNTYVIPGDLWCDINPFRSSELYSWYMVSDRVDSDSMVRVNRKMELVGQRGGGNQMVGIAYLTGEESVVVKERLKRYDQDKKYDNAFWEETLLEGDKFLVQAKVVHGEDVVEINTYEQLRELDEGSNHLRSDAISIAAQTLKASEKEITEIEVLKKGMTNRSFCFSCRGKRYIMRIPGEGTDQLIDRAQEAAVYASLSGLGICDDPIYLNPFNGYKITEYLEGVKTCDPHNQQDLRACMKLLKMFHDMDLKVEHTFDLFGRIEFFETLWNDRPSIYSDYKKTKEDVFSLREYIEAQENKWCLTHIDAVPDNFLFYKGGLQLTDWEYAGMQDPHVDIAMFCIYALYDKKEVDNLIDLYFDGACSNATRIKIYCYISVCGLLWSNWCEYKCSLGVEFGEYSLRQYRYAKDYYRLVMKELNHES